MNTDYAKEKLAEYNRAREAARMGEAFEFGGFGDGFAFAAGMFASLTESLVEELDRLQAKDAK